MKVFLKYGIIMFFAVISSCENRDWNNPFDPDCPKELFTPSEFTAAQEEEEVKLTWVQSNSNISGFVIERSVDGGTWSSVTTPTKNELTWSDTNIIGGKVYSYRLAAKAGTNRSNELTAQVTPVFSSSVTTLSLTKLLSTSAILGGEITSDGGAPVTARGVCWSTSPNPTIGNSKTSDGTGTGSFTSTMTGLNTNTTYYARAYATTSVGTSYGNEISFKTYFGEVTDIDGNIYPTVKIGEQIWMAENLKVTKYNDGTAIPNVTDDDTWFDLTTGAYCWYSNEIYNKNIYGALYNWYAVNTGKLAPEGWHVPTDEEWTELSDYLGGVNVAGGKLKETGTTNWQSPNTDATNEYGFNALPGGTRNLDENGFVQEKRSGVFWSSTSFPQWNSAWGRAMFYSSTELYAGNPSSRVNGNSVRCILGENPNPIIALPSVSTTSVSQITSSSAILEASVLNDGNSTVTERGFCWGSWTNTPTIEQDSVTRVGAGEGNFNTDLVWLESNTTYYVRAYAINSEGISYGEVVSFTTSQLQLLPVVTTATPENIIPGAATLGGNIINIGASEITQLGVCWNTNQNPTTNDSKQVNYIFGGDGTGNYTSSVPGFLANTTYYVRAYAINSYGTSYGQVESFKSSATIALPTVTTNLPDDITTNSAILGGHVDNTGGTFVSEWGVVYGISPNPTVNNDKFIIQDTDINGVSGSIGVTIRDLIPGTNYYVRAYATNSQGTGYGEQKSFTTEQDLNGETGTFTDSRDGIEYKWVKIGEQVWMAENLAYLPNVSPPTDYARTLPHYYVYDYFGNSVDDAKSTKNFKNYGCLYNWVAASTACPEGWHLPSYEEWENLAIFISNDNGGYDRDLNWHNVGNHLKSNSGWDEFEGNSGNGTDDYGFNAFPGGEVSAGGHTFVYQGKRGFWWTSSENGNNFRFLRYDYDFLSEGSMVKEGGLCVRCIRD